jgi:hypothetical protein
MIFTLSTGEVIHIDDAVTLTVLAIEGDLVRFGLDMPEGRVPTQAISRARARTPTSGAGRTRGNSISPSVARPARGRQSWHKDTRSHQLRGGGS